MCSSDLNVKVLSYEKKAFFELVDEIPVLEREVRRQISNSFLELQSDRSLSRESVSRRLASVLLALLGERGENSSRSIPLPLSRADLARRIGAEPETVVRIMKEWEREGVLLSRDRIIEIRNPGVLNEISRGSGSMANCRED